MFDPMHPAAREQSESAPVWPSRLSQGMRQTAMKPMAKYTISGNGPVAANLCVPIDSLVTDLTLLPFWPGPAGPKARLIEYCT